MQTEPEWLLSSVVGRSQHIDAKLAQNILEFLYTFKNTDCNLPKLKQVNKEIKQTNKQKDQIVQLFKSIGYILSISVRHCIYLFKYEFKFSNSFVIKIQERSHGTNEK